MSLLGAKRLGGQDAGVLVCVLSKAPPVSHLWACQTLRLVLNPPEYSDLVEVFIKKKATALPPHQSYDRAIDLALGTCLPQGKVLLPFKPSDCNDGVYSRGPC